MTNATIVSGDTNNDRASILWRPDIGELPQDVYGTSMGGALESI